MMKLVLILVAGLMLRAGVGLWGYSGAGTPPMYGDFEAQRHWMEVTTALPMKDWYFNGTDNNLQYWGLDYPPLTAYVSYAYGRAAQVMLPSLVELHSSRGHESREGKMFMRGTVLLSDILILFPALVLVSRMVMRSNVQHKSIELLVLVLTPPMILIDHGHFQYNGISIGLTLFAVLAIVQDYDCFGSFLFSLSLNFKQMSLYHAPVFFIVLLRKCLLTGYENCHGQRNSFQFHSFFEHLSRIGGTVLLTFGAMWFPFCLVQTSHTCTSVVLQILTRIFPFSRGIFEDKVSNVWYLLSVIYDYRDMVSREVLVRVSLLLTLTLLFPVLYGLMKYKATPVRLLLGLTASAIAYFLVSFQVHEKSLLLALVPASILLGYKPIDMAWFQLCGCMSMYPLLKRDGQAVPYFLCSFIYSVLCCLSYSTGKFQQVTAIEDNNKRLASHQYWFIIFRKLYFFISVSGVIVLHLAEAFFTPPTHLPDIFPALFAIFGCCNLLWYYLFFVRWLLFSTEDGFDDLSPEKAQKVE